MKEGCHITSMAGTWMSIVEGFGGMRIKNDELYFSPKIPEQWDSYSFKINFRHQIIEVTVCKDNTEFKLEGHQEMNILVNTQNLTLTPGRVVRLN